MPAKAQKKQEIDLTRDSIRRGIITLAVPLVFSSILQILFNISDLAVIGHFSGKLSLGAVGSSTQLVVLFADFLFGFGGGLTAVMGQYFGQRNNRVIKKAAAQAFILSMLTGLLVTALAEILTVPALRLMGTRDELFGGAVVYLRWYCAGLPGMALYNYCAGLYNASGETRKPVYFLALGGVINIFLNLFFVIVLHLDVMGVALASTISQYISGTGIFILMYKEKKVFSPDRESLRSRESFSPSRFLLTTCLMAGVQSALFSIANLFIQYGVNSLDSDIVAANSAASNGDAIVYSVMLAFYTAGVSFISQNYGAGNLKRVRTSYFFEIFYSFAVGLILGILLVILGRPYFYIFTTDPGVIEAGLARTRIMGFSYAFSAFMDGTIAACRGLGKTSVPTVIVLMGSVGFRVIWIFTVFRHFHTIQGLYSLYFFSWMLTSVFEMIYFFFIFRKIVRRHEAGKAAA